MSTFTPSNGPCESSSGFGGGASSATVLQLIEKYEAVLRRLSADEASIDSISTAIGNVADLDHEIDEQTLVSALNYLLDKFTDYVSNTRFADEVGSLDNLESEFTTKQVVAALNYLLGKFADYAAASDITDRTGDTSSLETTAKNLTGAVNELLAKFADYVTVDTFTTDIGDTSALGTTSKVVVEAVNELLATLSDLDTKVNSLSINQFINFNRMTVFNAQYSGITTALDSNGIYIIGMLADDYYGSAPASNIPRPGRLFLKYVNSKPFNAIIDVTCDGENPGNILVQYAKDANNQLTNLAFHLIHSTDGNGVTHTYVGVSCDEFGAINPTEGQMSFRASGINVLVPGQTGFMWPQTSSTLLNSISIPDDSQHGAVIEGLDVQFEVATDEEIEAVWDSYFGE